MRLKEAFRARTKRYASAVVRLYVELPRSRKEVEVLGHQLLRSATLVAAHTREAPLARSDAEFCSRIDVALQEADESHLCLQEDCGIENERIKGLHQETNELIAIFATMAHNTKCHTK